MSARQSITGNVPGASIPSSSDTTGKNNIIKSHYDKDANPETWSNMKSIDLTAMKVKDASGTRKGQKSQKVVMGFSASQVTKFPS